MTGIDRNAWRDQIVEEPIDPGLPIIDPHHHIWDNPPAPGAEKWGAEDLFAYKSGCGHNIVATMFVESAVEYRTGGPPELAAVGETDYAERVAREAEARGGALKGINAGIVAGADLIRGAAVGDLLDAHAEASARLRGVRSLTAYDPDMPYEMGTRPGMLIDPAFREGVGQLAPRNLSLDVWLMQPQMAELAELAKDFPETTFVLDHVGTPLGVGRFAKDRGAAFDDWRGLISRLAELPNVFVKLGGLNMPLTGLCVAHDALAPWGSEKLAEVQGRHILTAIELFGTARCMFESNFPPDRELTGGMALWNAFKRLVADFSHDEKHALFFENANRIYRLGQIVS